MFIVYFENFAVVIVGFLDDVVVVTNESIEEVDIDTVCQKIKAMWLLVLSYNYFYGGKFLICIQYIFLISDKKKVIGI